MVGVYETGIDLTNLWEICIWWECILVLFAIYVLFYKHTKIRIRLGYAYANANSGLAYAYNIFKIETSGPHKHLIVYCIL